MAISSADAATSASEDARRSAATGPQAAAPALRSRGGRRGGVGRRRAARRRLARGGSATRDRRDRCAASLAPRAAAPRAVRARASRACAARPRGASLAVGLGVAAPSAVRRAARPSIVLEAEQDDGDVVAPAGVVGGVDQRAARPARASSRVRRGSPRPAPRRPSSSGRRCTAGRRRRRAPANVLGVDLDVGLGPERAGDDRALRVRARPPPR